jgi:quercetin dioxygenase-like cupin family protein
MTARRTFALLAIVGGDSAGATQARRPFVHLNRGDHMNAPTSALRATIVTPDQALPIRLFDMDAKVLLTTEATGGTVSVVLGNLKPGDGPPDHVHFNQDEMFFILEGTCEFGAGDQTTTCGPGTIVFVPRNVVHRFKNVGDTTARVLEWSVPGGLDHYFKAISDLAAHDGFTREQAMEIAKKFDTNFLGAH